MKDTNFSRPHLADDATMSPSRDEEKHLDAGSGDVKEATARSITGIKVSPGIKWFIVVVSVLSSAFLFALDNTVVADVQPDIIKTFGDISLLPWLGVGFALGGVTILPWGKAYGVFNVKWLFITNIVLFEAGSALCGGAPDLNALIVGRVLAGVGGAGMYVGCLNYLSMTTTVAERPLLGAGTVLGPIVGGAFASSSATWRWAFYINLIIGAVFAPAYLLLLPSIDLDAGTSFFKKLAKLDWVGTIVFIAFLLCLTMAMTFGGTLYPWNSGSEIALWVVTGVTFVLFALVTKFHPLASRQSRLYPAHFLKMPIMVNLQIQLALVSGTMLTVAYYLPLIYQFSDGDSAIRAGVRLLPFITLTVIFALLNDIFLPKMQYYAPCRLYGYSVLIGAGAGSFLQTGYAISQSMVDVSEIPNAVGFMSVGQDVGIVILLSVAGSIYSNKAALGLTAALPGFSKAEIETIVAGTATPTYRSLSAADKITVIDVIVSSINDVFGVVIAAGAICLILSVFFGTRRLNS
ncbi:MAG: hypothetical protein Q9228_003056 [Teloschistes exilis]